MNNKSWQTILSQSTISVQSLLEELGLHLDDFTDKPTDFQHFKLKITPSFRAKIQPNTPNDPILIQFLPKISEQEALPEFSFQPLLEQAYNPTPGILHKFHGRALITLTPNCAVHCRYCFRQNFDYLANIPNSQHQKTIMDYLNKHPDIFEVILSGGDPLIHNDDFLSNFFELLTKNQYIKILRIHSRLPTVLPERFTEKLIQILAKCKFQVVLVMHCNHPQELDHISMSLFKKLAAANVTLLNQTVLLKDVNDNQEILASLSRKLFHMGVLPYYLHLLDKVTGSQRFLVHDHDAIMIYKQLLSILPGYLVPKLVREVPGTAYKQPVNI